MTTDLDSTRSGGAGEQRATGIEVQPLSVHIGAEIGGVDLSRPLAPDEVSDIWAALLRW